MAISIDEKILVHPKYQIFNIAIVILDFSLLLLVNLSLLIFFASFLVQFLCLLTSYFSSYSYHSFNYCDNTEKKPFTNLQILYTIGAKIKSHNFWYQKVVRVITIWGAIEKCLIFLLFCILGAPIIFSSTIII